MHLIGWMRIKLDKMSFWSYMKTGDFWKQLLLVLVSAFLLVFLVMVSLRLFTRHGEEIKVADIRGLRLEELRPYTEEYGFRFVVRDSVYDMDKEAGLVLAQSPLPGSLVKRNRTFYLTVSAALPPSVQMPNLTDLSIRQASALLETYGLSMGRQIPVPSIAKGAVIRQFYQGEEIEPGTLIRKGSTIDLEVGNGNPEALLPSSDTIPVSDSALLEEEGEYMEEPEWVEESAEPEW